MLSGRVFERLTSELPTGAIGSSFWPTAASTDWKGVSKPGQRRGQREEAAKFWPTPVVLDSTNTRNKTSGRSEGSKHHAGSTLVDATALWATPHANCITGPGAEGRDGGLNLQTQATRFWHTPKAARADGYQNRGATAKPYGLQTDAEICMAGLPDPTTSTLGPTSCEPGRTSRLRLNPAFVEWLMGFPAGWTLSSSASASASSTGSTD